MNSCDIFYFKNFFKSIIIRISEAGGNELDHFRNSQRVDAK